ncbi:MAG: aldehyde ferredoxin oxidoreductase, partial [Desulfatitalea sp.]|nr:aldehyde ferredoxin oxidoreductase [Desulfatitalea sp.]
MMHGYLGKILVVDLSNQTITTETIDAGIYESFLSGMGLGAYYLYKAIPAHADPLGPENIIGFVSGLLTGTGSLMTGRWMVVCKSPLTGGWGDANCGGTFSIAIKRCGYDAIFVKGMSSHPVYLYADNDGAQIRNAEHVWGKDAVEAETILQKESRKNKPVSIAVIGTAGEKRSLIAGVVNDQGRIAARSGVGAVMGSKRLKAVVLNGAQRVACHDKKQVMKISKELSVKIKNSNIPKIMGAWSLPFISKLMSKMDHASALDGIFAAAVFKKWGTIYNNALGMENGDCPVKNWQGSVKDFGWRKYRKLNPGRILKRESKKYTCYSCVIACGGICNIKGIKYGTFSHTHKPEYETCNAFGALLLNDDLEAIYYINELLNRAGMDSISAGNTVAFAMECFENGVIDEKDTDGLVLRWGNAEAIIELIKKMIQREGIGDLLADGVKKAMAHFGKHSRPFGIHAGGQEPGMHDSRMDPMLGVHFSVE